VQSLIGYGFHDLFIDPPAVFWIIVIFLVGTVIGSFLNVCIYRLPMEKSIIWPQTSHCMSCYQPIRWYDNIPLVSYWKLEGRCRTCGQPFSIRIFMIELFTGLLLAGLFYLEVIRNIHGLNANILGAERYAAGRWAIFAFHSVLLCLLMIASFSDFDHQIIPLPLTVTGTIIGLAGSVLFPWSWPYRPTEALVSPTAFQSASWTFVSIRPGLYPWPVWGPLPSWLQPGGTWLTGLATGIAGMLLGSFLLRAVRFLFGLGMGAEFTEPAEHDELEVRPGFARRVYSWVQRVGGRALGLGDADLMMMAGSFLGWQPILVAFGLGVGPGLILGLIYMVVRRTNTLPFGPALSLGVVATFLSWHRLGPHLQPLFFDRFLMLCLGGFCIVGLVVVSYFMRLVRRVTR
jgi:leader peptidase (prepilin peptidase)/N-methyltransferase